MARGVKGSGPGAIQIAGQPMTSEDLQMVEERIEGQRAPLHEDDHPLPKGNILKTADGRKITQVGNFQASPTYGDSQTLKKFARIEPDYSGWVKVTNVQALLYQELRVMIGHDGDKKLGLIDFRKLDKIKQKAKEGNLSEKEMESLEQLEEIQ